MMAKPRDPQDMRYEELTRFITALERSGGDANVLARGAGAEDRDPGRRASSSRSSARRLPPARSAAARPTASP